MRDLTFRKKKDKFNSRQGETAERFKAVRTFKTTVSNDAPAEKVQRIGEMLDLEEDSFKIRMLRTKTKTRQSINIWLKLCQMMR